MKAIETYYNNRKFRSRLEARWAVFFDSIGLLYEYEYEGFDINGEWYLPDFYFPKQKHSFASDCWAEVKPFQGNTFSEVENFVYNNSKIFNFIKQIENNFILLDGSPDFKWYLNFMYHKKDDYLFVANDAYLFDQAIDEDRWFVFCGCDRNEMDESYFESRYVEAVKNSRFYNFKNQRSLK